MMFLMALPHRRLSFPEPGAELVNVVRMGELACLPATGTLRRAVLERQSGSARHSQISVQLWYV